MSSVAPSASYSLTVRIAGCVSRTELGPEYIIPSVFNKRVAARASR